jgi:hypothetical protein
MAATGPNHLPAGGSAVMKILLTCVLSVLLGTSLAVAETGLRQEQVHFREGESSTTFTEKIKGYQGVDYRLDAKAGQSLAVTFTPSNLSAYFNVLPPGSHDVAMFVGSSAGNRLERVLATDGVYTIRVYLMRNAARRNESSAYSLTIGIKGKPLLATPSSVDAVIPGTPFHASTTITCAPFLDPAIRKCEAFVIRRGFDGTASVEIVAVNDVRRCILFVKGQPVASDSQETMTSRRKDNLTIVSFGGEERYEIPDALIFGG